MNYSYLCCGVCNGYYLDDFISEILGDYHCLNCLCYMMRCKYCLVNPGKELSEKSILIRKYEIEKLIKLYNFHTIPHHCIIPIKNKYMNINIK